MTVRFVNGESTSFNIFIYFNHRMLFSVTFKFIAFASSAGGLRNCNAAAFAFFKKYAIAFFESRLHRDQTKRCGLCNYWFKLEAYIEDSIMILDIIIDQIILGKRH